MFWQVLSTLSSITTLILFVAYIIGHVWHIKEIQDNLQQQFQFQFEDNVKINSNSNKYLDLSSNEIGRLFSLYSNKGFEYINIYKTSVKNNSLKTLLHLKRKAIITDVKQNEKFYIKVNIPDTYPGCYIKLKQKDGIKIQFGVYASGDDGSLIILNYKYNMTLKSWIYYLCTN